MLPAQKLPKKTLIIIGVWVAFVAFAALSGFSNGRGDDRRNDHGRKPPVHRPVKPVISWSPEKVRVNLSPGATTNIAVHISAAKPLRDVCLAVSPNLKHLVTLTPTNIPVLPKDQPIVINLTVKPAVTVPAGFIEGMIFAKERTDDSGKCDRSEDSEFFKKGSVALPVTIQIALTTYTNAELGVNLSYPDLGLSSVVDVVSTNAEETILDIKFKSVADTNYVSGFGISLFKNPNHLSLPVWFQTYIDPKAQLTLGGAFTNAVLANGNDALILSGQIPAIYLDEFGPVASIYVASETGNTIYSMVPSQVNEFDLLGLSPVQINQMLRQVATGLQAP